MKSQHELAKVVKMRKLTINDKREFAKIVSTIHNEVTEKFSFLMTNTTAGTLSKNIIIINIIIKECDYFQFKNRFTMCVYILILMV